jgi:hypothetical protein
MATKVPGFSFSGYRFIAFSGDSLISMEDMKYMLDESYGGDIMQPKTLQTEEARFFF